MDGEIAAAARDEGAPRKRRGRRTPTNFEREMRTMAISVREQMAFLTSAITPSISPVPSLYSRPCQLHRPFFIHVRPHQVSATSSVKLCRMQQFHGPPKFKMYFTYTKNKLWEFIPDSVRHFPWKEAKGVAQQELLVLGKEALKWSLTAILIFSFASDIIYSISRNKELLIPFGLFVGCLMTNYLNEVSQELSHHDKEGGMTWQLLGIYCFFIFVNVISVYFPVGGKVFLLHVANGGLMQVLWHWRSLLEQDRDEREICE
ncbi:embryo defective [Abeliophyllum distichum]|uniref:Embryo defective n=1 Tax=Abeliophyllum distichum TaxID=126358 RepID=A0ABD1SBK5_9LAMI